MYRFFLSILLSFLCVFSYAQVTSNTKGVGVNTHTPRSTMEVQSIDGDINPGVIVPNKAKEVLIGGATTDNTVESTLLFVNDASAVSKGKYDAEVSSKGFYYWDGERWVRVMQKAQIYLPSIVVKAERGREFKLDLYNIYASQFTMGRVQTNRAGVGVNSNDISTGTETKAVGVVSSSGAMGLRIFNPEQLEYYVVYYDKNVFENLSITEGGVLTYSVKTNAEVTEQTFMNIVLQEK